MAGESLLTVAEMLASFPDNTQNLIQPLNQRDMVLSEAVNVGFLRSETPFTIPITDGVYTQINSLMPTPDFTANFWALDANQAFIESYTTDYGIIVSPDTNRLTGITVRMYCQKAGAQAAAYTAKVFLDGVEGTATVPFTLEQGVPEIVTITGDGVLDYSLRQTVDVRIAGDGTADDIDVSTLVIKVEGWPL